MASASAGPSASIWMPRLFRKLTRANSNQDREDPKKLLGQAAQHADDNKGKKVEANSELELEQQKLQEQREKLEAARLRRAEAEKVKALAAAKAQEAAEEAARAQKIAKEREEMQRELEQLEAEEKALLSEASTVESEKDTDKANKGNGTTKPTETTKDQSEAPASTKTKPMEALKVTPAAPKMAQADENKPSDNKRKAEDWPCL